MLVSKFLELIRIYLFGAKTTQKVQFLDRNMDFWLPAAGGATLGATFTLLVVVVLVVLVVLRLLPKSCLF